MKFSDTASIPLEDFFKAYYQCRKRKRRTINALEFEVDYESNLVKLWKDVNSRNYKIGKSICFIVTKPKIREIFAADFRDRIVHHVVMMRLEPLFEEVFIEDNYNCRKNKGTLYGVKRLSSKIEECVNLYGDDCYIGKFDMQGFFMSIHKPTLLKMLKDFVNEKYDGDDKDILLWLIEQIIMNCPQYNCIRKSYINLWDRLPKNKSLFTCGDEYGLPIGNLTSQCFANFYLHKFDIMVENMFTYYGRYVDDFYIIWKNKKEIIDYIKIMEDYLWNNLRVKLHPNKIYLQHYKKGIKFIGSIIKRNRIYISNSTVSNAYTAIYNFNRMINEENSEHMMQSLNSYWGFLKHHNSYNLKIRLLKLLNEEWFRFITYDTQKEKFEVKKNIKTQNIISNDIKCKKQFCEKYYAF